MVRQNVGRIDLCSDHTGMSEFPFLIDLGESHLIPSRSLLKQWKPTKLAELCYLYFIALRIMLAN